MMRIGEMQSLICSVLLKGAVKVRKQMPAVETSDNVSDRPRKDMAVGHYRTFLKADSNTELNQ